MRTPKLFNKYTYIYNQMDLQHLNHRSLLCKYHNVLLPRIIYTDTDQQWGQQKNQCNCHRLPHSENQLGHRYILRRMKSARWHNGCLYKYIYSLHPPNVTKIDERRLDYQVNSTPAPYIADKTTLGLIPDGVPREGWWLPDYSNRKVARNRSHVMAFPHVRSQKLGSRTSLSGCW